MVISYEMTTRVRFVLSYDFLNPILSPFIACYVTSTPGHVLTTSLLRPKKIKDVVRTWYGLVGRGRNVVRT